MNKIAFLLVIILCSGSLMAQQTYAFAHRDTGDLKLDVYQPSHPRSDHACVLYVFGGGFYSGERNSQFSQQVCTLLAERGFVVAAIDYRLYMAHPQKVPLLKMYTLFDTAIRYAVEDCSDAIAFVCRHAEEFHIDTSRIILTGSSAGAITVLQTDYSRCNSLPAAKSLPQGFRPAAVIPYSGAILCRNNSLRYAIPPAPTCMFHGTCDKIVNYKRFRGAIHTSLFGSSSLAKVFKRNGYNYWIMRYDGLGHEIAVVLPKTLDEFCAFADAALSGRIMQYDATCHDSRIQPTKWSKLSVFDLYLRKAEM